MLLDMTLDYVNKVISGEIGAPREVVLQCKVFLRDYDL